MTPSFKRRRVRAIALVGAALAAAALPAAAEERPIVTAQPDAPPAVAPYLIDPAGDPPLANDETAALVREKIKYVFVIFNENHSFDNEFGTFPGVDGLYSDGAGAAPARADAGLHPDLSPT